MVGDEQIGGMLRTRIGMDRMRAAWAARRERLPRDHGHLAMMDASMTYLRQFAPAVLAAVRFAGGKANRPPELKRNAQATFDTYVRDNSVLHLPGALGGRLRR